MIRILSEREYRFTGYGVRIVPGVNELRSVPYGLRKSFERHEKAGHFVVEWDAPDPEPQAPPVMLPEPEEQPVAAETEPMPEADSEPLAEDSAVAEGELESLADPETSTPKKRRRRRR